MAEGEAAPKAGAEELIGDAGRVMRNVLVLAVADGEVAPEEKAYIEALRGKLGVDPQEFNRLCEQVRGGDRRIILPSSPVEAEEAMV